VVAVGSRRLVVEVEEYPLSVMKKKGRVVTAKDVNVRTVEKMLIPSVAMSPPRSPCEINSGAAGGHKIQNANSLYVPYGRYSTVSYTLYQEGILSRFQLTIDRCNGSSCSLSHAEV
jgi:hypothetical protein